MASSQEMENLNAAVALMVVNKKKKKWGGNQGLMGSPGESCQPRVIASRSRSARAVRP